MQIIIPGPEVTRGDIGKALEREIRTGVQLLKTKEEVRRRGAAAYAKSIARHKPIKGLGRCVAAIPEWEFYRMHQKYGREEVHSKEFLKYLGKKFPELAPHKI